MDGIESFTRGDVRVNVGILPIATLSSLCGIELLPGVPVPPETHPYDEQVIIVDGEGDFLLGNVHHRYYPGKAFDVPARMYHAFEQETRTVFLRLVVRRRLAA